MAVPKRFHPLIHEIEDAIARSDGRQMLRSLRRVIIETATDNELRWLWAAARQELGDVLAQVRPSEIEQNLEDIINTYQAALEVYTPSVCPVEYATVQNNLGNTYRMRRRGVPEENTERAILAYLAALTVRTRDTDPYGWARTQNNLGNAYAEHQRGNRAENQRLAIGAYRAALEIHGISRYPYDYGMEHTNPGLTYQDYVGGVQIENLDLAMVCFLRALLVRTPEVDPRGHRRLVLSLAEVFHARVELTPEDLRGDVATSLGPVVEVLVDAQRYLAIPTGLSGNMTSPSTRRDGEAGRAAEYTAAGVRSWLPDRSLFAGYLRDRYRLLPLPELIEMITSARARTEPAFRVELLRAALARDDVVLPSLRANLLDELGVALLSLRSGDVVRNQDEAISALVHALAAYTRNENSREWGTIQSHLAAAFGERISGDRAENLERAIQHCTVAIETRPSRSAEWTMWVHNLGLLYRYRRLGDPSENFRRAVAAFHATLDVWTHESHPYEWAKAKNSLGLTYQMRPGEAETLEEATGAFEEALTVLTPDEHPYEWAGVQFNLATALRERRRGDRSDNIERAIDGFTASLSVRTRDRFPVDWARTQHNLGQIYRKRLSGERVSNLGKAAECLRAALEVHTLPDRPADHRRTVGALGEVAANRGDWLAAHDAFVSACAAEDLLLAQVSTGVHGFDDVVRQGHEAGVLDAFALVQLGRLEEAVEAVERGRARWLAESLAVHTADSDRIGDPDRRQRYIAAREAFVAAQAAVNHQGWRHSDLATGPGHDDATALGHGAEALTRARALQAARERFEAVVTEIRQERDPTDFLDDSQLSTSQIAAGVDHAVVYLFHTEWGGLALAVLESSTSSDPSAEVLSCSLPALTDAFVGELVQVVLDDGSGRIVGGYGLAQEGVGLHWMVNQWPGDTFAEKAGHLHTACVRARVDTTLDASAQAVLQLRHLGLAKLLDTPLHELDAPDLSRLATTLGHAFLRAELHRCLPKLAEVAMKPLTGWLLGHGVTSMTLVPCGLLPAFPALAALLDHAASGGGDGTDPDADPAGGTTVADRLTATVAPSARSVLARTRDGSRSGVYTLGDPHPTHQELRWGQAEALTVAALAGDLTRARIREAATRGWLVESLGHGRVVTASCHGQFDGRDFLRSRLLLADGETLTLRDALSSQVDLTGLRLLVMSACQTAVLDIRGAYGEVRSLAAGMLQAGARAVMAPLWAVDDRATCLLVVRFAQEWLPVMDEQSPAEALARAQAWLRTVTRRELAVWETDTGLAHHAEQSGSERPVGTVTTGAAGRERVETGSPARPQDPGVEPYRAALVGVRSGGDRYTVTEAEQSMAERTQSQTLRAGDEAPYADPIFWAGFQIYGW